MGTLASILLLIMSVLVAIPVLVFLLEIVAATICPIREDFQSVARPKVAVLVPAHNESSILGSTLDNIKGQLRSGDRLLVIADNCTDDTSSVAACEKVEVIERNDPTKIGKGYALEFGLQHLSREPPDVVVLVDADCLLAAGALETLLSACISTSRPDQALYLMAAPTPSNLKYEVAEFAWRVKNWVRPLGLRVLDLPCQLMGSGIAFPWKVIRSVDLASGWIVEDLKLGCDLAIAGHPPDFAPLLGWTACSPRPRKGAHATNALGTGSYRHDRIDGAAVDLDWLDEGRSWARRARARSGRSAIVASCTSGHRSLRPHLARRPAK
jgi:glycosyltransferase involved in cell wall biosynthesis